MKKEYKVLIFIGAILFLLIGIIMLFIKEDPEYYLRKEVTGQVTNLKIENFSYEKVGRFYNITADLIKTDNSKFNSTDYSIYLLDENNNLLYLIDGKQIGQFDSTSNKIPISMQVEYEISSAKTMIIIKKEYGYKFNKDLRDNLKKVTDNRVVYPD